MANPDLDELLNSLVGFAEEMLAKCDAFYPFGAYMDIGGGITHLNGWTGDEHPAAQELIDMLIRGLRESAERGDLRASGICLDVRTIPPGQSEKTDAICVRLEHVEGDAVEVFIPYRKCGQGEYEYGELFACNGVPVVFAPGGDAS